jgi:hypothetical protein
MSPEVSGLVTYKRWRRRDGVELEDVVTLVHRQVVPHYRRLDPEVRLGLESVVGTPEVLASQHWPDQDTRDRAMTGEHFPDWWRDYQPILAAWDELVEFVAEWESHQLL